MKLITTSPLERYDIPAFGLRMSPQISEARRSYYAVEPIFRKDHIAGRQADDLRSRRPLARFLLTSTA